MIFRIIRGGGEAIKMRKIFVSAAMLFVLCGAALAESVNVESYDLVILNGRVMDPESNFKSGTDHNF